MFGDIGGQKRVLTTLEFMTVCELPCRSWDLNSGPLKGQQVLLIAEPAFQAPCSAFLVVRLLNMTCPCKAKAHDLCNAILQETILLCSFQIGPGLSLVWREAKGQLSEP